MMEGTHGPAGLEEEVLVLEPQVGQRRARARVERHVWSEWKGERSLKLMGSNGESPAPQAGGRSLLCWLSRGWQVWGTWGW